MKDYFDEDSQEPTFSLYDFKKWLDDHQQPDQIAEGNQEIKKEETKEEFKKRFKEKGRCRKKDQ